MEYTLADRNKYHAQKCGARIRGIDFNLTFDQWWDWWQQTRKYPQRGKGKGKYVMARFGDIGPYELGNIYCCTHGENVTAAHKGVKRSQAHRDKLSAANLGKVHGPRSQATKDRISAAQKGRVFSEEHKAAIRAAKAKGKN